MSKLFLKIGLLSVGYSRHFHCSSLFISCWSLVYYSVRETRTPTQKNKKIYMHVVLCYADDITAVCAKPCQNRGVCFGYDQCNCPTLVFGTHCETSNYTHLMGKDAIYQLIYCHIYLGKCGSKSKCAPGSRFCPLTV